VNLVDKIKKLTPKQWAMVAGAGTSAGLLVDYMVRKDHSLVMQAWHRLHGFGGGHSRIRPHPSAPRPPTPPAMPPPQTTPMPTELPLSAVFVEPYVGPGFVPAVEYGRAGYHYPAYGHLGMHPHHVGAAVAPPHADAPHPPEPTRTNVPPPGALGIVAQTPPAPTDGDGPSPCGPGLYFDQATQTCLPLGVGPNVPSAYGTNYGWEG
jgi:hypothetical protein